MKWSDRNCDFKKLTEEMCRAQLDAQWEAKMKARSTWIAVAIGLVMALGTAGVAGADAKYVGASKCKTCHKKELIGNQYGAWEDSAHAKAFELLKGDKAKEVAAAKGISGAPHEAAECLECHATAQGLSASQVAAKPLKVADGVQCESCHGPGSDYKKKKTMADHAASVAAGMWEPDKKEAICTACHNDKSPTWDAAKGFDFEARKKDIAHPIPADVKGRYAEAAKEAKAKK
jgi:hypothetical protein